MDRYSLFIFGVLPTSDLNFGTWAGLAAAAALIGTFWRNLATWAGRLTDLIVCKVVVKDEAFRAVMAKVVKEGRVNPLGIRMFGGIISYVAPKHRSEIIGYESFTCEPRFVMLGGWPTVVNIGIDSSLGEGALRGVLIDTRKLASIRFFRGTIDIESFIESALAEYNRARQIGRTKTGDGSATKRFSIIRMSGSPGGNLGKPMRAGGESPGIAFESSYPSSREDDSDLVRLQRGEMRLLTWKPEDLTEKQNDFKPFAAHPVCPEISSQLAEIGTWLSAEDWFRTRGIPWSRGYLLHGPSGSGKSTIVRNVAQQYDLPIYTFDLSSYDNKGFAEDWKTLQTNAPAIALIEDIDCVFDGRKNLATEGKQRDGLTFDCLLNTISGVGANDGVLLFVTTNYLEKLDPALGIPDSFTGKSTRPGRINRAIYVGPMMEPERRKLAKLILSDYPDRIDSMVAAGQGEMAAQFQDRCAKLALALWEEKLAKKS